MITEFMQQRWMKWLSFIAYTALVGYVSLAPSSGGGLPLWDKAMHFTVYAIFVLLGCQLCNNRRQLLLMSLAVLIYGGVLEIIQSTVGRDMSLLDLLANGLGIMLATGLSTRYLPRRETA